MMKHSIRPEFTPLHGFEAAGLKLRRAFRNLGRAIARTSEAVREDYEVLEKLGKALEENEWQDGPSHAIEHRSCSDCQHDEYEGHASECRIRQALAAWRRTELW